MQYFERALGSVSRTWNSINPATLSGAIDVVVVRVSSGDLHCSAFHIRFGKLALLQPSQKGVDFYVNGRKMDLKMKLGEGGEAFFVFETDADVPEGMLTSPVISPQSSPRPGFDPNDEDVDYLDISRDGDQRKPTHEHASEEGVIPTDQDPKGAAHERNLNSDAAISSPDSDPESAAGDKDEKPQSNPRTHSRSSEQLRNSEDQADKDVLAHETATAGERDQQSLTGSLDQDNRPDQASERSQGAPSGQPQTPEPSDTTLSSSQSVSAEASTPDMLPDELELDGLEPMLRYEHPERIDSIIRKLRNVKLPAQQDTDGHVIMDMSGYKTSGENAREIERVVNRFMRSDESPGASPVASPPMSPQAEDSSGNEHYQTPEPQPPSRRVSAADVRTRGHGRRAASDHRRNGGSGNAPAPSSDSRAQDAEQGDSNSHAEAEASAATESVDGAAAQPDSTRKFVKTLRLSSDILQTLDLHPGENEMRFVVRSNGASTSASIHLWDSEVPVVISDIDGTITKSDAMGHLMALVGIDWTHAGVGRLFSDIHANGYNIMYLTSRSVGLADSTRSYLRSIAQGGYRLPPGPVILSPDRTIAALRREVILRKPEVFKMACLRDIAKLYEYDYAPPLTPFYAGFGNRITDAISYRSVGVPSTKIFTINTESEVRMELLELTGVKSSYIMITDLVDQLFPPVHPELNKKFDLNSQEFSDTNYWKQPVIVLSDDALSDAALNPLSSVLEQDENSSQSENDLDTEIEFSENEFESEIDTDQVWDSEDDEDYVDDSDEGASDDDSVSDNDSGTYALSDTNEPAEIEYAEGFATVE